MSTAPSLSDVPGTTEGSAFEAMFVHVLQPTGTFARELAEAGFDPGRMVARYPSSVWYRCLDIGRRHTFPELPPAEGFRMLGRSFMEGYFTTLIGKVVSAALPLYGLQRTLDRLPRVWKGSQPTTEVTVAKEGPHAWRVTLNSPGVIPEFSAGVLEAAAKPVGEKLSVEVVERSPLHCVLRVLRLEA